MRLRTLAAGDLCFSSGKRVDDATIDIEVIMRITLIVVGALLMFFGAVWFFQGINVLPGSFMTGQMQWAVYGGIAFAAGVLAVCLGWRRSRASK